jgi:hypothetical protein
LAISPAAPIMQPFSARRPNLGKTRPKRRRSRTAQGADLHNPASRHRLKDVRTAS